jgi:chromosome segregation protein
MLFFKRLELHGFKSFANKTSINFLPGVTVIVGPNGCGKSNIFDSVRWALGEQSARSLRGARMGDVIFNGSASVKATGMAKVNLVLDNSREILPVDFDEVSIARHLFRTGESEYLLNRSNCRLKDITGLLMDTGVGTDSYSVMEQGKVDAIINSKPLERRVIFDEAAGISKYKAKKAEALNKLVKTDEDLLRLADIINEVRRQANSLKRQASKAERYKRLSAELKTLEMELLVGRYFGLREGSSRIESLYVQLSGTVNRLRDELATLDEQQEVERVSADDVQRVLDETQTENYEVGTRLTETEGQITVLRQRIVSHGERREALAQDIRNLEERARGVEAAIAEIDSETESQASAVEQLDSEYAGRKSRYEELKANCDGTATEAVQLRQSINAATRERMTRENEMRVAHVMESKITGELEQSDAEFALLRQQVETLGVEKDERQASSEEIDAVLVALKADLQTTSVRLQECDAKLGESVAALETARREEQASRSRHDALAELQANFDGYFGGVKQVMLEKKSGSLGGIVGVVSTLIEADGEHELAIEAALGSHAQDIVVNRAEDAKAAIRWLKSSGKGRATFLPLDLVEPREMPARLNEVLGEPGVVGVASTLVRHKSEILNAVRHLLGTVIVCRDLDVAVDLERRGYRAKYVTLDGEMVSPQGAMTGGSVKSQGLLHRTREIRELADTLAGLRAREAQLAGCVAELRDEVATLRQTHAKLASSVSTQEVESARVRKDLEMVQQKLDQKSAAITAVSGRRSQMESEIAAHRRTQEQGDVILNELGAKLASLEEKLATVEAQSTVRQRELAESAHEMNELVLKISMGRERIANLRDRREGLQRDRVRLASEQTNRQRDIESLRGQEAQATVEIDSLVRRVGEMRERQRLLAEQITFETQRKETIHLDLRKLGERSQELRRDLNEHQNNLHEVELKRTENQVQLANIANQAMEKFNSTVEDVVASVTAALAADAGVEEAVPEDGAAPVELEAPEEGAVPVESGAQDVMSRLRPPDEIAVRLNELREKIDDLGPVHVGAIDEYNELNQRYEFLTTQERDLVAAKAQLAETIHKIDDTTTDMFVTAFGEIRSNFEQVFRRLFGGGRADLILTEENGVLDSGIDIVAQPPGKKPTHISLLSGGERALTAIALLFAIFLRKPSPVCILDEVDAPLDDTNIERFKDLVREFSQTTQFIIITHNKQTMALANTIYGVTMEEQGVSRVVSLRLDEYEDSDLAREVALA